MFEKLTNAIRGAFAPKVKADYSRQQNWRLIEGGWWGNRPWWPNHTNNIRREVTIQEWRTVVSACNKLYWNFGVIHGAIEDKATYAVGRSWQPIFQGQDKEWGKLAAAWLEEWYKVAYVNGSDFITGLYLDSVALDRDGDTATIYTETETGFPQLQQCAWHTIASRDGSAEVKTGPYAGLKQYNGVILNTQGRAVAFRFMGETEDQDREVSARSVDYLADARTQDQTRGFPAFTPAIMDLRDLVTTQGYIKQAMLIASSIGLIEQNELGVADMSDPSIGLQDGPATGATGLYTEEMVGGTIRYFRANSGAKLEQLKNEVPSEATDRLMERLIRNALLGAGMPPEFYWKAEASGANTRVVIAKVNRTVADRQDVLRTAARRRVGYAISKAIKLGLLPKYKGDDIGGFLKWNFSMPPILTADAGYAGQDAREAYKLGMRNLTDILGEQGKNLEQHLDEREAEEIAIRERMQRSGLPESSFRILTPNGNPPDAATPQETP